MSLSQSAEHETIIPLSEFPQGDSAEMARFADAIRAGLIDAVQADEPDPEPASTLEFPTAQVFEPLLAPARYKGAWGGRGSAKSWFFADMLIEYCFMRPGLRAACIREVQRSLEQSVKRLLEDRIQYHGLGEHFKILKTHIITPNDGMIIFQGMQNHTADSIKSLEGYDLAWVEEAQTLSQRSLDLLRPTLRKEGSEIWFSWNPRSPHDPVDKFLRTENPDVVVVNANFKDNPWFPEVLRAEMEWDRSHDIEKYRHIWEGQYESTSSAQVFKNWVIDEFDTPEDTEFLFGADWGFAQDPTVLVRCWQRDRHTLMIDAEAYKVGCEIDATPSLFDTIGNGMARAYKITADNARPETISYLKRNGYPRIEPAAKGAHSVEEGVSFLKNFNIIVHPRCRHTIDELTLYRYKTHSLTGDVLPVIVDADNHCIDALRYAVEKLRRASKSVLVW